MTRFNRDLNRRVERDLDQIANSATPSSSTAWEAIRQRVDEQDSRAAAGTEPTVEVIMLDPEINTYSKRPRTGMLVAASVAALTLVGGLVIVANRDGERAPADRPEPAPTVPVADPAIAGDPAPLGEDAALVDLATEGVMSTVCTSGPSDENEDGSSTRAQACLSEAAVLPIAPQATNTQTVFPTDSNLPDLFVSVGDNGSLSAGYATPDGSLRYSGLEPGVGDYANETIFTLGVRPGGSEQTPATSDWTTEPGNAPLPTTEEGGISAEVTVTCTTESVSADDTLQVLDQTCTYLSSDDRFITAPELVRVRVFLADPADLTFGNGPTFFTAQSAAGSSTAGVSEDGTRIRAVGVRAGAGDFEGLAIHDVMYLTADPTGNVSGEIRSTVYPELTPLDRSGE